MTDTTLAGRVVVVTGAAQGTGAATVHHLVGQGAIVYSADVAPFDTVSSSVRGVLLDVARQEAWSELATTLERELDGTLLHGLVNNAGITYRERLGAVERSEWDRVLAVNLTGPMLGIQALAPLMAVGSSVVNVGSSAALTAHYPVAYTASKWGLRGLSRVAAAAYGPRGIRVNMVHPGFIETAMTANAPEAMRTAQLESTPLERMGYAGEVAEAIAFLLSDSASYISGAELTVDGAFTAVGAAKVMADRIAAAQFSNQ